MASLAKNMKLDRLDGTLTVEIKLPRRFRFRLWLGVLLIRAGARLMPIDSVVREVD